jgi:hypothetical protein
MAEESRRPITIEDARDIFLINPGEDPTREWLKRMRDKIIENLQKRKYIKESDIQESDIHQAYQILKRDYRRRHGSRASNYVSNARKGLSNAFGRMGQRFSRITRTTNRSRNRNSVENSQPINSTKSPLTESLPKSLTSITSVKSRTNNKNSTSRTSVKSRTNNKTPTSRNSVKSRANNKTPRAKHYQTPFFSHNENSGQTPKSKEQIARENALRVLGLDPDRNPHFSSKEILDKYLNIKTIDKRIDDAFTILYYNLTPKDGQPRPMELVNNIIRYRISKFAKHKRSHHF